MFCNVHDRESKLKWYEKGYIVQHQASNIQIGLINEPIAGIILYIGLKDRRKLIHAESFLVCAS
jgi:hypothetical protein